jgi:hypothetical protein
VLQLCCEEGDSNTPALRALPVVRVKQWYEAVGSQVLVAYDWLLVIVLCCDEGDKGCRTHRLRRICCEEGDSGGGGKQWGWQAQLEWCSLPYGTKGSSFKLPSW